MANKKLLKKFVCICKCGNKFDLIEPKRENIGYGKSGNSSIWCHKCGSFDLRVNFTYETIYRHRCITCNNMFSSNNTYNHKCPSCNYKEIKAFSQLGS